MASMDDTRTAIDIFHSSLTWETFSGGLLPEDMRDAQAVWLGDKLYVGGGKTISATKKISQARVYTYTPASDIWRDVDTPAVYLFALVTYHSQLVLVGGKVYTSELEGEQVTNKLLTLTEHDQWKEILPHMPSERWGASAVEYADNILVAGGGDNKSSSVDIVEVYNGHLWAEAQCLPKPSNSMKSTVFNEHWYLAGGFRQGKEVYYVSLNSLVASYQASEKPLPPVWKTLPDVPMEHSSIAAFGNTLIAVGVRMDALMSISNYPASSICAYSPITQSWECVEVTPFTLCTSTAVLPTGELIIMVGKGVYKVTLIGDDMWKLPGVEECSETSVSVSSSQGHVVDWSGVKLHIHKGSLPEGLHQLKLYIKASVAGEYEFPEKTSLVSAVFWMRCEPQCTFTEPIMVEIQHCSMSENVSKLKIVRAVSSRKHGSYEFKSLGGRFDAGTSYGAVEVNHFCGMGVVEEESSVSTRRYYCQPFYRSLSHQHSHEIRTCIIFVWNTEAHKNRAIQKYSEDGFTAGFHKVIEVVGDVIEIALEVAKWTKVMDDGQWEIQPAQPRVTKVELDDFKTGRGIPACVLEACSRCQNFPELLCEITLKGIKPPQDKLVLSYTQSSIEEHHKPEEDVDETTSLLNNSPENPCGPQSGQKIASGKVGVAVSIGLVLGAAIGAVIGAIIGGSIYSRVRDAGVTFAVTLPVFTPVGAAVGMSICLLILFCCLNPNKDSDT